MATAWNSSIRAIYGISIHATHTGGDCCIEQLLVSSCNFNPRHPYGWRRYDIVEGKERKNISIHATHTGGDGPLRKLLYLFWAFQSTPPIRVATRNAVPCRLTVKFQSTPPIRVATQNNFIHDSVPPISIHATHTGGDSMPPSFFIAM